MEELNVTGAESGRMPSDGTNIEQVDKEVPQEAPQKELTLQEYKKAMRLYFTVVRDKVTQCGHKFHPENIPQHRNCESCWFTYFEIHGEATKLADEVFREKGEKALAQIQGEKYVKMFKKFMATVAKFVEENKANVVEPAQEEVK